MACYCLLGFLLSLLFNEMMSILCYVAWFCGIMGYT